MPMALTAQPASSNSLTAVGDALSAALVSMLGSSTLTPASKIALRIQALGSTAEAAERIAAMTCSPPLLVSAGNET
jgi:hypothetical protein